MFKMNKEVNFIFCELVSTSPVGDFKPHVVVDGSTRPNRSDRFVPPHMQAPLTVYS